MYISGLYVGWTGDETPKCGIGISPTLRSLQGGEGNGFVLCGEYARKFTITELERIQGIPDGYTHCIGSFSRRKSAIGNSFCVPVMRWIMHRIDRI